VDGLRSDGIRDPTAVVNARADPKREHRHDTRPHVDRHLSGRDRRRGDEHVEEAWAHFARSWLVVDLVDPGHAAFLVTLGRDEWIGRTYRPGFAEEAVAFASGEHVLFRGIAGEEVLVQLDASRVDGHSEGLLSRDLEV